MDGIKNLSPDCIDWLKSECNRYVNGNCTTRSCYIRGGWDGKPITLSDFQSIKTTCMAHEILERLNNE